jgi:Nif-specific regulatory protein
MSTRTASSPGRERSGCGVSGEDEVMPAEDLSRERLALLYELSRAFNTLMTLDELLPSIIAQTKAVLQAESCALLLLDEERQELYFPIASDLSPKIEARFNEIRFPADKGVVGWALHHGQPVHVPDVSRDPRWYSAVDRHTGGRTRELLCAPLRTRHGVIGVLELRNKLAGMFSDDDLNFLTALAGSVAVALENARLYEQLRWSEARLREEVATLHREIAHRQRFEEIVGASAAMSKVFTLMESAIPSPITVLLQGETGTGKEIIARAIHYHGPRQDRPFVAVNCGALTETLLESELFGHKKGAFTGAMTDKPGFFEVAHGGTIFLDEISDTSTAMQVKLLRVLQEGEIRRVGETKLRRVDVRVISATNKDLAEEVRQQRFREDLYYRLNVFPIHVPPLRERREDIPLLASQFLQHSAKRLGKRVPGIAPQASALLMQYHWPGNVRELHNEIERAVALAPDGAAIAPECLSEKIAPQHAVQVALPHAMAPLKQARLTFERQYIAEILRQNRGHVAKSAKLLGISRQMLQKKIKDYGLRAS